VETTEVKAAVEKGSLGDDLLTLLGVSDSRADGDPSYGLFGKGPSVDIGQVSAMVPPLGNVFDFATLNRQPNKKRDCETKQQVHKVY
jgi:hypothetical protein